MNPLSVSISVYTRVQKLMAGSSPGGRGKASALLAQAGWLDRRNANSRQMVLASECPDTGQGSLSCCTLASMTCVVHMPVSGPEAAR